MRPLRRTTANWRLAGCRRRSTPSVVWRREILPWVDVNGNRTVEGSEVDHTRLLFFSGAWDPARPTFLGSVNTVDPNIKNDRTREFIAGIDRELTRDLAVGASYIWRNYDRFLWDDRLGFGSEHYAARTFQPTAAECPVAGARCDPVSYYEPTILISGVRARTNVPDRDRSYNGFELTARKRLSNRWMGNFSVAFNNAVDQFHSGAACTQ